MREFSYGEKGVNGNGPTEEATSALFSAVPSTTGTGEKKPIARRTWSESSASTTTTTTTTSSHRHRQKGTDDTRLSAEEAANVLYHFYHLIVAKKVTRLASAILNEYNDARVEEEKAREGEGQGRPKSASVTIQTPQEEEERRGGGRGVRRSHKPKTKKLDDIDEEEEVEEEDEASWGRAGIGLRVVDSIQTTGRRTKGVARRHHALPKKDTKKQTVQKTPPVGTTTEWKPSPPALSSSSSSSSPRSAAGAGIFNGNEKESGEGEADRAARLVVHFFRMVVAKRTVHRLWNRYQDAVDERVGIEKREEVEEKKKDPAASTRPPSSTASSTSTQSTTSSVSPPSRVLSKVEQAAGRKICALFQQFIARRRLAMLQVAHLARLAVQVREDNQSLLPPTPLGETFSTDLVQHMRNRIWEKEESDDQKDHHVTHDDYSQSSLRPGTEEFHRDVRPPSTTPTTTGVYPSFRTPPPTPEEDSFSRRGTSGDVTSRGSQGDDKWEYKRPPTTSGDSDNLVVHRNDPGRATATPASFDTDSRLDSRDKTM